FAQIELGRLDAAKEAYEESLKLEPGNKLAESELRFIEKRRKQVDRKDPAPPEKGEGRGE
ncbi:MAG: hypothetical protein ACOC8E_08445, partial [Planctomycetota bacterium]